MKSNSSVEIFNQKKFFNNIIDTFEIYRFINFLMNKKKMRKGTLNLTASKPIQIKKMILDLKSNLFSKSKITFKKKSSKHFVINTNKIKKIYKFKSSTTNLILNRYINNFEDFLF